MVRLLQVYPDMTFIEKTVKTKENKIIITKDYTPEYKIGTSVFRERSSSLLKRIIFFWKKPRNMVLLVNGAPTAVHLEGGNPHPALAFNFGTMDDSIKFLKKVTYKSIADRKPIRNNQFLVIVLMIGAVLMFQFMIMKGVTI